MVFSFQLSFAQNQQEKWKIAVQNLQEQMNKKSDNVLLHSVFEALADILWTGQIQDFPILCQQLTVYFTQEWLTNDHKLAMLNVLKDGITSMGKDNTFIENTCFMTLLENVYRDRDLYSKERCYEWLRQRSEELVSCHWE